MKFRTHSKTNTLMNRFEKTCWNNLLKFFYIIKWKNKQYTSKVYLQYDVQNSLNYEVWNQLFLLMVYMYNYINHFWNSNRSTILKFRVYEFFSFPQSFLSWYRLLTNMLFFFHYPLYWHPITHRLIVYTEPNNILFFHHFHYMNTYF